MGFYSKKYVYVTVMVMNEDERGKNHTDLKFLIEIHDDCAYNLHEKCIVF